MIKDPDQYRARRVSEKAVTLPGGDEQDQIEIRTLSAGGFQEIMQAQREAPEDHTRQAYIACKWGVVMCAGMLIEDVRELFTLDDAVYLAAEIIDLSGMNEDAEKNSPGTPVSDSNTA